MKKITNNRINNTTVDNHSDSVDMFILAEQSLYTMPELTPAERNNFEHEIARSHLYHSSKIEGSTLNEERLAKAINA